MKALAVLVVSVACLALACSSGDEPEGRLPPTEPSFPTKPSLPTEPELPPREPSFNSVVFIDESRGWLTAYLGEDRGDVILATTDGGESWDEQYTAHLPGGGIRELQFVDELHGWAVIADSREPLEAKRTLLRTTDGGATWSEVGEFENFFTPQFVSHTVGWGTTSEQAGAGLMRTQNGGLT